MSKKQSSNNMYQENETLTAEKVMESGTEEKFRLALITEDELENIVYIFEYIQENLMKAFGNLT